MSNYYIPCRKYKNVICDSYTRTNLILFQRSFSQSLHIITQYIHSMRSSLLQTETGRIYKQDPK